MQEKRKYKKEAAFFLICLLAIFCGVFVPFARVAPAIAPIDSKILVEGETISGELKKTKWRLDNPYIPDDTLPDRDITLDVPYLSQEGILPTGCEVTSAAMVIQYWGSKVDAVTLAEKLPCGELFWGEDGLLYGPNPKDLFVGSPFDNSGYGCFAPVIAGLVPTIDENLYAEVMEGLSLEELYGRYVLREIPVLVWCTINMLETTPGTEWKLPDGSEFKWPRNEHCMVLIGRTEDEYICLDPYDSNGEVHIERKLLESRYRDMGSQAVLLLPNDWTDQ